MLRMAIEYLEPGMALGRDIYGVDGRIILAAGATITEKYISIFKKWEIMSVYVENPIIVLPPIDEVMEESIRLKSVNSIKNMFSDISRKGLQELSQDQKELIKTVITAVIRKRFAIIHLAQIQHHANDLFSHSMNVAVLSTMTAITLGMTNSDHLYSLAMGAMLHDVGMIAVPQAIIAKRTIAPLTAEESEILEGHAQFGYEILRKVEGVPLLAAHIAWQHHEKIMGQGYPRKITGKDIHELAKIVAVANAYDNLIADSPQKKGMQPHLAYEAIVSGVNVDFDAAVAEAFLRRIALYPIGTLVKLTTGKIGVVTGVTPKMQHRPIVEVIADENSRLLPETFVLNLADIENLTIFVTEVISDMAAVDFLKRNR